jgi:hypothetical protein
MSSPGNLYVGLVVLGAVGSGSAQNADKLPRFEVASVKPARPGKIGAHRAPTPGRLTLISIPMQALIQYAFRAPRYLLSAGRSGCQYCLCNASLDDAGFAAGALPLGYAPGEKPDETPRALNPAEQLPPVDPNGASIFAAIQEQPGLRMVPQRGSINMLVIDRVDRVPSENQT